MNPKTIAPGFPTNLSANLHDIARDNLVYVDKSIDAYKLINYNYKRLMILRPPKFGKSIIVDIIEAVFLKNISPLKALNCRILTKPIGKIGVFPVLRFSLRHSDMDISSLPDTLNRIFIKLYDIFGLPKEEKHFRTPTIAFSHLLSEITKRQTRKIVVLIEDIESVLIKLQFGTAEFYQARNYIQGLFNVLRRYLKSVHYLLFTGIANFYDISDLVKDVTYLPDTADIFGFSSENISNASIFEYKKGSPVRMPPTKIKVFGSFQETLQDCYKTSISDFQEVLKYDYLQGRISIDFLAYIMLNTGGYRFSPFTSLSVINPVDFITAIHESRIGSYWLDVVFRPGRGCLSTYFTNFFSAFPGSDKIIDHVIMNILVNNNSVPLDTFTEFQFLVPFGFLTFRGEKLAIPNQTLFELMTNSAINRCAVMTQLDYLNMYRNFEFRAVVDKFYSFLLQHLIPEVICRNNCWDFALFIYICLVFPNAKIKIANDSTFLAITDTFIISIFFSGDATVRLRTIEQETNLAIYLLKLSTTPNAIVIEGCHRQNTLALMFLSSFNPNTVCSPNLTTSSVTQNSNTSNINMTTSNSNTNTTTTTTTAANALVNEDECPRVLSVEELVADVVLELTSKQTKMVPLGKIMVGMMKRVIHMASDPTLEKAVVLSLQHLCEKGSLKYFMKDDVVYYYMGRT